MRRCCRDTVCDVAAVLLHVFMVVVTLSVTIDKFQSPVVEKYYYTFFISLLPPPYQPATTSASMLIPSDVQKRIGRWTEDRFCKKLNYLIRNVACYPRVKQLECPFEPNEYTNIHATNQSTKRGIDEELCDVYNSIDRALFPEHLLLQCSNVRDKNINVDACMAAVCLCFLFIEAVHQVRRVFGGLIKSVCQTEYQNVRMYMTFLKSLIAHRESDIIRKALYNLNGNGVDFDDETRYYISYKINGLSERELLQLRTSEAQMDWIECTRLCRLYDFVYVEKRRKFIRHRESVARRVTEAHRIYRQISVELQIDLNRVSAGLAGEQYHDEEIAPANRNNNVNNVRPTGRIAPPPVTDAPRTHGQYSAREYLHAIETRER